MKSVKQKIMLSMVAVIVIGMVVSGAVSVAMSFRNSSTLTENSMKGTVAVTADRVEQELTSYLNVAKMAGTMAVLSNDEVPASEKQRILISIAQEYNMEDCTLIDANGRNVFDGNDYSDREYFQRALRGESYVATPVVSRVTGKPIISVVAPVYNGGTQENGIFGVLVFLPKEDMLNDIMASLNISEGNQAYMIDQDGYTIADSEDPSKVLVENVEEMAKNDKTLEKRAFHHSEMRAGKTGVGTFPHNDHTDYFAYAPIEGTDGWSLALSLPDRDFMGAVYTTTIVIVVITLVVMLIGVLVAIRLATSIGKPIQLCTERIDKLAQGNLSDPVQVVDSEDEIGRLTKSTSMIVENIRNIISDMGYLLGEMASGNLDARSRDYGYYIGDYAAMIDAARGIARGVSSALAQIGSASNQVSAGSEQVSSGAQSLAQGATEQASAVEQLSATINDISQESQNTAERAAMARTKSNEAGALVQASNDYISKLDGTMDSISVSSQEIGKIIGTIENIAFQTNILALNAAVEAARAGQAGKGFAVVADEVRNLASKSDQAAKDTKQLIEKSILAVDEGVEMMSKVKTNMAQVMESAGDAVGRMVEVADAVARQNEAIMQVTQGIDQISSVVQTNSATAEQSAAASEELSGQAEMLKNLVASFKLRDDSVQ